MSAEIIKFPRAAIVRDKKEQRRITSIYKHFRATNDEPGSPEETFNSVIRYKDYFPHGASTGVHKA